MDNASDYGSEDSRFESWRARRLFSENEKLSSRLQRAVSVEFNVIPLSDFHFAKGKFDLRVPLIFDYFLSEVN